MGSAGQLVMGVLCFIVGSILIALAFRPQPRLITEVYVGYHVVEFENMYPQRIDIVAVGSFDAVTEQLSRERERKMADSKNHAWKIAVGTGIQMVTMPPVEGTFTAGGSPR